MDAEVLVVGAGAAGLAVAACLRRRGVEPLVVDRGAQVGESWAARYDRLHLHTPRGQSRLPGLPIPRRYGRWVAKDDMAAYLREYASRAGLAPRFGTEVRLLDRADGGWRADTGDGPLTARQVVLATGYNREPFTPGWRGREAWPGELVHASAYRGPAPFRGREVLVVGSGNTGAEIATDLAEGGAARVRLSVRTAPNVVPRQIGPVPITLLGIALEHSPARLADPVTRAVSRLTLGDLTPYGLPAPQRGVVARARTQGTTPTIDVGLVRALRAGEVTPVAAVAGFDRGGVVLADGTRLAPDAVVAATGFVPALEPVVGHLGVLDGRGRPRAQGGGTVDGVPGLRFVGISVPLKGLLLQISLDARRAAAAIARELAS